MANGSLQEKTVGHTPGPWSVHPIGISEGTAGNPPFRYRDIKIGAGDTIIAEVNLMQMLEGEGGYPHVEKEDEHDANARLIVAAPELLVALRDVIDAIPDERLVSAPALELVDRLENYYQFECEGGPLKNCVDWQRLKALIATSIDRPLAAWVEIGKEVIAKAEGAR